LETGYLGFNYDYKEKETVLNQDDIMRMWGLSKFLVLSHQHSSRM
jgi:hypothetical protein